MRLAFNIELRENKEYLLSEEDSKKVLDMAFELAKKKYYSGNEDCLYYYIKLALHLLLDNGEIEGVLFHENTEEELTSVWKQEE